MLAKTSTPDALTLLAVLDTRREERFGSEHPSTFAVGRFVID